MHIREAGLKPSFIIGGEVNEIGTGAVWDDGEEEADVTCDSQPPSRLLSPNKHSPEVVSLLGEMHNPEEENPLLLGDMHSLDVEALILLVDRHSPEIEALLLPDENDGPGQPQVQHRPDDVPHRRSPDVEILHLPGHIPHKQVDHGNGLSMLQAAQCSAVQILHREEDPPGHRRHQEHQPLLPPQTC